MTNKDDRSIGEFEFGLYGMVKWMCRYVMLSAYLFMFDGMSFNEPVFNFDNIKLDVIIENDTAIENNTEHENRNEDTQEGKGKTCGETILREKN